MAAFTVVTIEAVPDAVRGTLTRWMIEPVTGVFVGPLPARVREAVWAMVSANVRSGRTCMVYPSDNEQGFVVRTAGDSRRTLVDYDGIQLIAFE